MLKRLLRERSRSRAVEGFGPLDRPAEPGFDIFVEQAARSFAAPIGLMTLLHQDRLWIKASTGIAVQCAPREDSFCDHAVDGNDLLEVCDARIDPVFRGLPAVTNDPFVRYYIGAPLRLASGVDVGALCVLDTKPRSPASRDQRAYLLGLARQATEALERQARIEGGIAA